MSRAAGEFGMAVMSQTSCGPDGEAGRRTVAATAERHTLDTAITENQDYPMDRIRRPIRSQRIIAPALARAYHSCAYWPLFFWPKEVVSHIMLAMRELIELRAIQIGFIHKMIHNKGFVHQPFVLRPRIATGYKACQWCCGLSPLGVWG